MEPKKKCVSDHSILVRFITLTPPALYSQRHAVAPNWNLVFQMALLSVPHQKMGLKGGSKLVIYPSAKLQND